MMLNNYMYLLLGSLVVTLRIYLSIATVYILRGQEVLVINVCSPCSGSNVTRTLTREVPSMSSGPRVLSAIGSAVHSLRYQLIRERFRYDRDIFGGDSSPAENVNIANLFQSSTYQPPTVQCHRNLSARCLYHQLLDVKVKLTLGRLGFALRHGLSLQWSERLVRQALCYTVQLASIVGQELPNFPCLSRIQINSPRSRAELSSWIFQALNESIQILNNILLRSRRLLRVL